MNRLEPVVYAMKRFRLTYEKIAVRLQIIVKMLNNLGFGAGIEVDEDIGADYDIKCPHEQHFRIIIEVEIGKSNRLPDLRRQNELFGIFCEIFLQIRCGDISHGVGRVDPFTRLSNYSLIYVGTDNFKSPIFKQGGAILQE